jgi:MOSC domain-containing protein YiiM
MIRPAAALAMRIVTISTGAVAPLFTPAPDGRRETVMSAIRKTPRSTLDRPVALEVAELGFVGDEQADLTVHGGRDKAVYAFPVEHYPVWQTMREQATKIDEPLPHGFMGENLTIEGLLETRVWIGDVLVIDAASSPSPSSPSTASSTASSTILPVRLRVDSPRFPCFKFNARMGFKHASKMMVQSGFTGFYLEVLQPGTIAAGDTFRVIPGAREVTIEEAHRLRSRGQQNGLF